MNNIITINADKLNRPASNLNYKKSRTMMYNENTSISILIQAFGRIDKTEKCINNVLKHTNLEYELILLDNGTPGTEITEYFASIDYKKKKVIRVSKNITGVYALDKVFKILNSKYIVMIPNDVIVTPNWLENMLICAESDESIGMVVASSTNVSNLQYESLGGFSCIEEMQDKAEKFNVSDPAKWEEKMRLIPTATLYRREIFDTIGLYDLGFMHDFGDDDFTFRVRRAGYKLMLCRDTFVHHDHDQATLSQERQEIMVQSREFFKDKYNGIDAWNDTGNYMSFAFDSIRFNDCQRKSILVLDVKCGTPLLEARNFLRKNNIEVSECISYTSDAKYWDDLISISDRVVCGDIESTIKDEFGKYDIIILGKSVNEYNKPIELLHRLINLKSENGYVIFPVCNTNDVRSLLNVLNISLGEYDSFPRQMNYNYILDKIADYGIKHADVTYTVHSLDDKLKTSIANLVLSMDVRGDKNEIMQNLLIENYWITAQ